MYYWYSYVIRRIGNRRRKKIKEKENLDIIKIYKFM